MPFTRTMRATKQEQTGGAGVSGVAGAFERLDWGVAENGRHDLGTDLFVCARDIRLFDLGLVVGVQVKTGRSYFDEPAHGPRGELLGWWFRDRNRAHVDAWLSHALPHLLVLHDLIRSTSYWVHVTSDRVISTGKGAKVLVPVANTIDEEHRQDLLEVAATLRAATSWEGSAWTGAESLAPRDLLRHALIVPRLVAPHPNAGYEKTLTPEQAVALLMQARLQDLDTFASKHDDVPSIPDAAGSPRWMWRFFGALGHRLTTGKIGQLLAVVADAPGPAARAAATISAAAGLLEEGRVDEAIPLLEAALARDDADPVDQAWLAVQHARACTELGRLSEARTATVEVQAIRATHADDVTASAIAGAAAELLFTSSSWSERSVANLIAGADTTASWWRRQTVSRGLAALVDRTFKGWARDSSITWGAADNANDQLVAASLTANHAGDHGDWCLLTEMLGQGTLLRVGRDSDPEQARCGLTMLRLAGAEPALKLAVRRLVIDGPAAAVALAADEVQLDASTRTTGSADLTLLQYGGDVLDQATADQTVSWLLSVLGDPSRFVARTNPTYLLEMRFLDTLAATVLAASDASRQAVVDCLLALPVQGDQTVATSWARVVNALPDDVWDKEIALSVGSSADTHHWALRYPLLGIAARHNPTVRAQLVDEAREVSLDALAALGDVRDLSSDVVETLVSGLAEHADRTVENAHAGRFDSGGPNIGRTLALLNLWHPAQAEWNALLHLLEDKLVNGEDKRPALQLLTQLADHLSDEMRPRVEAAAINISDQTPSPYLSLLGEGQDVRGPAAELAAALGVLDSEMGARRLFSLITGDPDDRRWAARVARRLVRPESSGILAALSQDPDPAVRGTAAAGLASLVAAGSSDPLAVNSLQNSLRDAGTRVPAYVAMALADAPTRSVAAQEALQFFSGHLSANVRHIAARSAS